MTTNDILQILEEFQQGFSTNKDSSRESELEALSLFICRQSEKDQSKIKDFLLDELNTNAYEIRDWSSLILIKLNDEKLISRVYAIFSHLYKLNEPFSETVFYILMKLRDFDKNHLHSYYSFVENILKINISTFRIFGIVVEYMAINPNHAANLLSNFYNELFISTKQRINHISPYIFIPYLFFVETTFNYMALLIQETYTKNNVSGEALKKLFREYAELVPNENKLDFKNKQKMIMYLNDISF